MFDNETNIRSLSTSGHDSHLYHGDEVKQSRMGKTFAALALTVMSFATILMNSIVLYVFKRNKKLRVPKYYCIISLAIADLLVGVISINPYTVTIVTGIWPFGSATCQIWLVMDHTLITISNATLLVIAFERFTSICYPISHRVRFNSCFMRRCIIGSWTLSFFVWSPAILIYPHFSNVKEAPGDCIIHFYENNIPLTVAVVFFSYIAPCIILTVIYATISYKLTKPEQKLSICKSFETSMIAQPSAVVSSEFYSSEQAIGDIDNPVYTVPAFKGNRERSLTQTTVISGGSISTPCSPKKAVTPKCLPNEAFTPKCSPSEAFTPKSSPGETILSKVNSPNKADTPKLCSAITPKSNRHITLMDLPVTSSTATKNLPFSCDRQPSSVSDWKAKCFAQRIKTKRKALKWILLVSTAFVVAWAPYHITVLLRPIIKRDLPEQLWKFSYVFGWLNSLLNPVCYAYANQKFNRSFKEIFFRNE